MASEAIVLYDAEPRPSPQWALLAAEPRRSVRALERALEATRPRLADWRLGLDMQDDFYADDFAGTRG